ncbi:MAG: tetratricopeptide repeat protein [Treponema sp.]|nr:tetratricopeptide repeat protein [Treponema sp.]
MKNGRIIFLEVPASLADEIKALPADSNGSGFSVDFSIPLPVETDDDKPVDVKTLSETLSWEMILAGMIRIVTGGTEVKPEWVEYYRRFVLALKPDIYNEFSGAAVIKAKNGDFAGAGEIITILEGLFPMTPGVLLNKALIQEEEAGVLEKKGCEMEASLLFEKAEETYTTALQLKPVLPELYFNLGFFYSARNNYAGAKEYFNEYLELAEDPAKINRVKKIIAGIEKSGLDNTEYTKSLELIRQGKEKEALALIHGFLEEHSLVWNGWFVLGWALRKQKRYSDALASFKKALELGGGTPDTRNETAICMMELGDLAEAQKELEAALRDDPENVKIISNLGMIALKKGRQEEAAGYFRTVLDLNPHDPLALKFFKP